MELILFNSRSAAVPLCSALMQKDYGLFARFLQLSLRLIVEFLFDNYESFDLFSCELFHSPLAAVPLCSALMQHDYGLVCSISSANYYG